MSYYDDPNYDYYEPSVADELLNEFQEKMKEVLLDSVKTEIDDIKSENIRLQEENKQLRQRQHLVDSKERQLNEKEKELDREFHRKKFSELLNPFLEKYSGYYAESEWRMSAKCSHCDKNREVTYTAQNRKSIKQKCDCNRSYSYYAPKQTVLEVLNLWKDRYSKEFGITPEFQDRSDDDYRWSKLKFTQTIDKFDESVATDLERRDSLFKSKDECQKFCDWLNKRKLQDDDEEELECK